MGIAITAGQNPRFTNGQFLRELDDYEYEAWGEKHENWCRINSGVFPRSIDGVILPTGEDGLPLEEVLVTADYSSDYSRNSVSTSYPEYGLFREALTYALSQHEPRWYWTRIKKGQWVEPSMTSDPYEIPFMDIINFSDAQGVIAKEAILRIADSFKNARVIRDGNGLTLFDRFQRHLSSDEAKRSGSLQNDSRFTFYHELEQLIQDFSTKESPILCFG